MARLGFEPRAVRLQSPGLSRKPRQTNWVVNHISLKYRFHTFCAKQPNKRKKEKVLSKWLQCVPGLFSVWLGVGLPGQLKPRTLSHSSRTRRTARWPALPQAPCEGFKIYLPAPSFSLTPVLLFLHYLGSEKSGSGRGQGVCLLPRAGDRHSLPGPPQPLRAAACRPGPSWLGPFQIPPFGPRDKAPEHRQQRVALAGVCQAGRGTSPNALARPRLLDGG